MPPTGLLMPLPDGGASWFPQAGCRGVYLIILKGSAVMPDGSPPLPLRYFASRRK
jgi:hypothetical protein